MNQQQFNLLLNDFLQREDWVRHLSYAILSLQINDGQQYNLSSGYHQDDGSDFVDRIYLDALLRGQVISSEDLTPEGQLYIQDLHIDPYRNMEDNHQKYRGGTATER